MSPSARSSQESGLSAVPAATSLTTPETSQETASSKALLVDENIALKQRLATLEMAENRLKEQITNAENQITNEEQRAIEAEKRAVEAEQRAVEAEKRTTAAKVEMDAAHARAQRRYTQMIHANNESRHLRIALDKEKDERAGFLVRSRSVLQGMKDEIFQLNADKANGVWAKEFIEQIDILQAGFVAGEEDKKVLKKIIAQLNKNINQIKSEKEVSDKMLVDLKSLIGDLRQEIDAEKKKPAPDAPTKGHIEALIAIARAEASKDATAASQSNIEAMKAKMKEHIEATTKAHQTQIQAQARQYVKTKLDEWRQMEQAYKGNIAALESKLLAATKHIAMHRQRLETASGAVQHSHQRPAKHGQEISQQEMLNPNKRRRLDSYGTNGITTPDFQHTRLTSLLSNTNTISPRSAANTNYNTIMSGAHRQEHAQMTPNNIHRRQSSQHSNSLASPMTPTQSFSRRQNGVPSPQQSFNMTSPQQQQRPRSFQQQMALNNASQQSPTSSPHGPYPAYNFHQPRKQMGNGQQTINQPGNLSLSKVPDFKAHRLQHMRQQVKPQVFAETPVPMQQQIQSTHPYSPVSTIPPPQPRATQVPSKRSMLFDAQSPNMDQEASRRHAFMIRNTDTMSTFDDGQTFMGKTNPRDGWFPIDEQLKRGPTPTAFTPTLPQIQQPQQRSLQYHNVDSSQSQTFDPRIMPQGLKDAPNEANMYMNDPRQPSVSGQETRDSSRSTPAPSGRTRRKTPGPSEPARVSCVNCYRHWWENECDEGEPCVNCVAEQVECVRQKCFKFAAGTCDKVNKCPNVHEGDYRYRNDSFLVDQTKAGKRPERLGKKTDAAPAPLTG